jgi:hypothetical protein
MLPDRTSFRCGWALAALAGTLLLAGCAGTTPTPGSGKPAPAEDKKPADKDGKSKPPEREVG